MARPRAKELTQRELEVMHVFWNRRQATVADDIRDQLELRRGRESGIHHRGHAGPHPQRKGVPGANPRRTPIPLSAAAIL